MSDETESEFEPDAVARDPNNPDDAGDMRNDADSADTAAVTPEDAEGADSTETAGNADGEHGATEADGEAGDADDASNANDASDTGGEAGGADGVSGADDMSSASPSAPMPVFTPLPEPPASAGLPTSTSPAVSSRETFATLGDDSPHSLKVQSGQSNQVDDLTGLIGSQGPQDPQGLQSGQSAHDSQGGSASQGGLSYDSDPDLDLDRGLARLDPLTVRPRMSSRILCVAFALIFAAFAAGVWWLGVHTMSGQNYDDAVYTGLRGSIAGWFGPLTTMFTNSSLVIGLSVAIIVVAVAVAALRRRWWLLGQMAVVGLLFWAVHYLKDVLPRPFIVNTASSKLNSAPSGHTLLAAAAGVLLLIAVGRAWRALAALLASVYAVLVGLSVIVGQWHRPTDVIMAILLIGAVTLLVLAFTRASGMDAPGRRASSPSIQIVASVMITAGVLGCLYAGYIIWQLAPGLPLSEQWTHSGAIASAIVLIAAASALVFGLVLAMRQLTASPLSKLGLVGAPPEPPTAPQQKAK
ncbi:MAG: phosphatase PAP2 family protein [Bifidobacterium tibiigranuli]|jgi:membrane-associated phospholipid phosphatase|uniref:phosphatase PAP2 family protein n=1 Tax=Bifidobacterium tibiigranuli TaxID=2172043 RepID=UPI00235758EF|nr:phosphatase PAP2 family protein [Bifidobacterium tibiigranuli]MCH3975218.1 phosphatase PAP2 family protein [Bifidobacterium tibiigranuli]MCH4190644.1 phosphatase PAP2 family protein [Bifidobacterium tibiigranuli]MCH4203416.1 phosphatase PAP2 family protein [Bifidobacterium tibiigranuli]MCH4273972.1 phosphatase PAP2 family protein [Bifidobacterium tibiigranuli]